MIKKRLLGVLSILMFAVLGISAQNGDWDFYLDKCPNYLYYEMLHYLSPNQAANEEVIRNDGNTEEIDGKTYNIVRLAYFRGYPSPVTPPQKELILHMRRDGQRLMIRYDEYKAVMEAVRTVECGSFNVSTILVLGTSMSYQNKQISSELGVEHFEDFKCK